MHVGTFCCNAFAFLSLKKQFIKFLKKKISNYLTKLKIQNTPKLKIDLNISFFIFEKK